jgi:hypothetical protein
MNTHLDTKKVANEMTEQITYLACPYTHELPQVRAERFMAANKAAAFLIRRGYIVFSPITMTHPIDMLLAGEDATLGTDYWVRFDEAFMDLCSNMAVLQLPRWQESSGVMREILFFQQKGRPIWFLDPTLSDYGLPT